MAASRSIGSNIIPTLATIYLADTSLSLRPGQAHCHLRKTMERTTAYGGMGAAARTLLPRVWRLEYFVISRHGAGRPIDSVFRRGGCRRRLHSLEMAPSRRSDPPTPLQIAAAHTNCLTALQRPS